MRHDNSKPRMTFVQAGAVAALAIFAASAADAQAIRPNLAVAPHVPVIAGPPPVPHVDPGITGRLTPHPQMPNLHLSPNRHPSCGDNVRCDDASVSSSANGSTVTGNGVTADGSTRKGKNAVKSGPRRETVQAAANLLTVTNDIIAEIDGTLTNEQADALARRHGLRRIESQNFPLLGATFGLFRITDGRSFERASRDFGADSSVRAVHPNFRYLLQQQKAAGQEGDPAQYVLAKMRLPEAHMLAHGAGIRVAVIDSAIDMKHRELASSVVDSYDALGSSEGPHVHGTGIAGAIAAHARLMGAAPSAELIAIRAFSTATNGAQSNSWVILKSLDYAFQKQARIINMSFAGPKDPLIERGIDAVAARNIVMVAAAGNAGAKSPPLYPAANPKVIAVSATDQQDHLFAASNRGSYIAVAAPGAELFLPAPDDKYQMTSGTSFSAAYVSGLAALMLERNPALKPEELRATLMRTARDLGSPGRDDLFGSGEADAFAALEAVNAPQAAPVANSSEPAPQAPQQNAAETREIPPVRALTPQVSTVASEKSTIREPVQPAAR
jgi:subtilisin family serine protease